MSTLKKPFGQKAINIAAGAFLATSTALTSATGMAATGLGVLANAFTATSAIAKDDHDAYGTDVQIIIKPGQEDIVEKIFNEWPELFHRAYRDGYNINNLANEPKKLKVPAAIANVIGIAPDFELRDIIENVTVQRNVPTKSVTMSNSRRIVNLRLNEVTPSQQPIELRGAKFIRGEVSWNGKKCFAGPGITQKTGADAARVGDPDGDHVQTTSTRQCRGGLPGARESRSGQTDIENILYTAQRLGL